jgi:hypothetical protein
VRTEGFSSGTFNTPQLRRLLLTLKYALVRSNPHPDGRDALLVDPPLNYVESGGNLLRRHVEPDLSGSVV